MCPTRALLPALVICTAVTLPAQTIQVNKDDRTIAITTTDEATAPADTAEVSIGFAVYGTDADSTYAEASKVSNAVLSNVRAMGATDEWAISALAIVPDKVTESATVYAVFALE